MALETNLKLATIFLNLGRVLAIEDEKKNKFRIIAYQNGARILQNLTEDISTQLKDGELPKIQGIGQAMQEKIIAYLHDGHIPMYDEILKTYPETFFQIFSIPHIGPKTAKILFLEYHVRNLHDLEQVINSNALSDHAGFGEKSVHNIREALTRIKKESKRLPLIEVYPLVHKLLVYMRKSPACLETTFAGSLRRFEDTIGDVDLLATSTDADTLIQHFVNFSETKVIQSQGDTKASIIVDNNLQIDLRVVEPDSFGAALQYFTGSKDHNIHLRSLAKDKELKLNEYGVFHGEKSVASKTEEDVYKIIGLHFIPPEIRRNQGEIEEAIEKPFPAFVNLDQLKNPSSPSKQQLVDIPSLQWENYPVLLNLIHEAKVAHQEPLFSIAEKLPTAATWQVVQREAPHFSVSIGQIKENWQKEVLIGLMRRARIKKDQVTFIA